MPSTSARALRIVATETGGRPFAAWMAGLSLAMLGCGTFGAMQPLLPPDDGPVQVSASQNEEIAILDFQPSSDAPAPQELATEEQSSPEQDVEIPPVPEIAEALNPVEMPELLEAEKPAPPKPPAPSNPKLKTAPKRTSTASVKHTAAGGRGNGNGVGPVLLSGTSGGRCPPPRYPPAAKPQRMQGMVKLLITVETNGLPTSVDVLSSSGFGLLDNAALDQVRRRWRWPSGPQRKYIAPVNFEIR